MISPIRFCNAEGTNYTEVGRLVYAVVHENLQDHPACVVAEQAEEGSVNVVNALGMVGDCFLSHSVRDRNYYTSKQANDAQLNRYKCIFVPGEWIRKRLLSDADLGFLPNRVIAVGHPRIDYLRAMYTRWLRTNAESQGDEIVGNSDQESGVRRLKVLWAPGAIPPKSKTQSSQSISTNPAFFSEIERLKDVCELVVVLHPRDRKDRTCAPEGLSSVGTVDLIEQKLDHEADVQNNNSNDEISKAPVLEELLSADVVISDMSSVIVEAWALGKPVIFPRWITGNSVIKRFAGSAEAYIHDQKIGYHPDSMDEMIEILQSPLQIGDDVHRFMEEYLINYRGGASSSAMIADVLRDHADPERLERKLARQQLVLDVMQAVPSKGMVKAPAATPRASIQLLQGFLLAGEYEFLASAVSSLRLSQDSAAFLLDLDVLEIESALAQGMFGNADAMIRKLLKKDVSPAYYYQARMAFANGALEECLGHIANYFRKGGRSFDAYRVLFAALKQFGEEEIAWNLAKKVFLTSRASEYVYAMLKLATTSDQWQEVKQCAESIKKTDPNRAYLIAEATIGDASNLHALEAVEQSADQLAKLLSAKRRPAAQAVLTGWERLPGVARSLLPYERLHLDPIRGSSKRHSTTFDHILEFIEQGGHQIFLSGHTLLRWTQDDWHFAFDETLEFGLCDGKHVDGIFENFRSNLRLESISIACGSGRRFVHWSGVVVDVLLYSKGATSINCSWNGLTTSAPLFELEKRVKGGRKALLPRDCERWLIETYSQIDQSSLRWPLVQSRLSATALDERWVVHQLCQGVVDLIRNGDLGQAELLAQGLKEYRIHQIEFALSGMDGAYIGEDFPGAVGGANFIIHIGDGVDAYFHIDLWHPYVKRVDQNVILAVRSLPLFDLLKSQRPDLNAVYIKSGLEAEWLVNSCPKLQAILYLSNTGNTVHFLRFNDIKHVFLGHGDSEKAASCHKFFRAYDEVWTAGVAHIDRFKNAGLGHSLIFKVVGRPTLREMLRRAEESSRKQFIYLPTWEGFQTEQEYTSVRISDKFIPMVVDATGYDAVVKFHPWVGKRVSMLNEIETKLAVSPVHGSSSIHVLERTQLAADAMPDAHFMIADVSSVVSDYLPLGRPIFLYIPRGKDVRTSSSSMKMSDYCYIFHDEFDLIRLIQRVIVEGDDYLVDSRTVARNYFVDSDRTMKGAFERALEELLPCDRLKRDDKLFPKNNKNDVENEVELPFIIGHRGAKGEYTENSLSGFNYVKNLTGLSAVEFDVHQTKDGELVVIHDPTIDRTTNGSGAVSDFTLDELKLFRLINLVDRKKPLLEEGIPTLKEVFSCFCNTPFELHVEIKTDELGRPYHALIPKLLRLIDEYGLRSKVVLTSFSPDVLRAVRYGDANIRIAASINQRSFEMMGGVVECLQTFAQIGGCQLAIERKALEKMAHVGVIDLDCLKNVIAWVVNEREQYQSSISLGVRMLTTDKPSAMIDWIKGN